MFNNNKYQIAARFTPLVLNRLYLVEIIVPWNDPIQKTYETKKLWYTELSATKLKSKDLSGGDWMEGLCYYINHKLPKRYVVH